MPSGKLLISGVTAALGVRVARSLFGRWRVLPESDREQAGRDLRAGTETFAGELVETAEADAEVGADDVRELREELRRELERLASADIKASRTRPERASSPG
jgi:hypothetical protein